MGPSSVAPQVGLREGQSVAAQEVSDPTEAQGQGQAPHSGHSHILSVAEADADLSCGGVVVYLIQQDCHKAAT